MNISQLTSSLSSLAAPAAPAAAASNGGFAKALTTAIGNVETTRAEAQTAASDLLAGGKGDVHTVALAAQSAELTLEMFQQVRNKFVSAYQEIMRMPM